MFTMSNRRVKVKKIILFTICFAMLFSYTACNQKVEYPTLNFQRKESVVHVQRLVAYEEGCTIEDMDIVVDLEAEEIDGYWYNITLLEKTLSAMENNDEVEGFIEYSNQYYILTLEEGVYYVENILADELRKMKFSEFCDRAAKYSARQNKPTGGYGLE